MRHKISYSISDTTADERSRHFVDALTPILITVGPARVKQQLKHDKQIMGAPPGT